jgi:hypothetical protein
MKLLGPVSVSEGSLGVGPVVDDELSENSAARRSIPRPGSNRNVTSIICQVAMYAITQY